jgi:hypothetical protein
MLSNSQAKQDVFVQSLSKKNNGLFFDIGSHHPIRINNTYALEQIGWKGYLFDIDNSWEFLTTQTRRSKFICTDVRSYNWDLFLEQEGIVGSTFDYLSFDVDEASLVTLKRFPFEKIKFNICTVEHDRYRFGLDVATEMRRIMTDNGYKLLCKDICNDGYPYEDWYVHSSFMGENEIQSKYCESLEWSEALKIYV